MSNTVAPLPTGAGVAPVSEHRSRQEQHRQQGEADQHGEEQAGRRQPQPRFTLEAAPLPVDAELVPAETLFAAALLANEMPAPPPSPDTLRLATGHGWTPPESVLRLKDKTI